MASHRAHDVVSRPRQRGLADPRTSLSAQDCRRTPTARTLSEPVPARRGGSPVSRRARAGLGWPRVEPRRPAGTRSCPPGLPRLRVRRAAAPGRPRGVRGRPRRGVRRPAPAPPRRPRGPARARQRPRGDRRGARRTAGRGHLHVVRHRGGAPRAARPAPGRRAPATAIVHSAVEHSAVLHAARVVRARRPRSSPVDAARAGSRLDDLDRARPTPRSSACQSANHEVGHGPAGRRGRRACRTASRSSSTRAPRPAGSRSRRAGRRWPRSAHKWGGPAGVGVLVVRTGLAVARPVPRGRPGRRARPAASRTCRRSWPRPPRCRRSSPSARPRTRGARARRPDPRAAVGGLPDVEVVGDPVGPAPPPGHVLLPLRRRRGAGDRAGPARVRGGQRIGLHRVDPRAEPRAGGDGRAHPRQRRGSRSAATRPRTTSSGSSPCSPTSSSGSGPSGL